MSHYCSPTIGIKLDQTVVELYRGYLSCLCLILLPLEQYFVHRSQISTELQNKTKVLHLQFYQLEQRLPPSNSAVVARNWKPTRATYKRREFFCLVKLWFQKGRTSPFVFFLSVPPHGSGCRLNNEGMRQSDSGE